MIQHHSSLNDALSLVGKIYQTVGVQYREENENKKEQIKASNTNVVM